MSDTTTHLLIDQALNGAVQEQIGGLIRIAAQTVQRLKPRDNMVSGMRESQLRNVVNVAIGAQNVEEIAAFLLYQMGRSTNSRQWLYEGFGDQVVRDLTAQDGAVRTAAGAAQARALALIAASDTGATLSDEEQERLGARAYIALARQYLGYLNRIFYYAEKARGWDRLGVLAEGGAL